MSKQHILKIHKAPLEALLSGAKTCEVRFNDRGFEVGDTVALREVNPFNDVWTGRPYLIRTISHIQTGYGLPEGLCVLSYAQPAAGEPEQQTAINADDLPTKKYPLAAFDFDSPSSAPVAADEPVAEAWRSMDTAPKDGTMLRLLVEFTDNDLEDSEGPHPTIGSNTFEYSDIDEWMFAGWDWQQDQFCKGEGRPIGWLPMEYTAPPAAAPVAAGEPVAKYRERSNHHVIRRDESLPCYCWAESDHRIGQEVAAPPAAAHGDEAVRKDAERYRWLRNPGQDVALVLDKKTGHVPVDERGFGGYGIYEYRAGTELDEAIDAAMRAQAGEGESA